MAADSAGNIYYLENDAAFTAATKLYSRSPSDNYATATPLFSYNAFVFGSFVRVEGIREYAIPFPGPSASRGTDRISEVHDIGVEPGPDGGN